MRHRSLRRLGGAVITIGLLVACGQVDEPVAQPTAPPTTPAESTPAPESTVTTTASSSSTTETTEPQTRVTVRGFSASFSLKATSPSGAIVPLTDTTALATSASGLIAIGSERGDIRIYTADGDPLGVSETAHDGTVSGLGFVGGTDELVSTGQDGRLRLWQVDGSSLVAGSEWEPHDGVAIVALAVSATGTTIATAGGDRMIRTWDAAGDVPPSDADQLGPVGGIMITALAIGERPDGSVALVAGTSEGAVVVVDVSASSVGEGTQVVPDSDVTDLVVTPDGVEVVVAGAPRETVVGLDGGPVRTFDIEVPEAVEGTSAVAVWGSPSGPGVLVAVGSDDGVQVFSDDAEKSVPYTGVVERIEALAFLRDGSALVLADRSQVVVAHLARD